MTAGAVLAPIHTETVSGDSWGMRSERDRVVVMVADGLGHGQGAAEASQEAVAVMGRTRN